MLLFLYQTPKKNLKRIWFKQKSNLLHIKIIMMVIFVQWETSWFLASFTISTKWLKRKTFVFFLFGYWVKVAILPGVFTKFFMRLFLGTLELVDYIKGKFLKINILLKRKWCSVWPPVEYDNLAFTQISLGY